MSDYQQQSMLRSMDNAYRLLSATEREAFDITLEPEESRKKYDTGRFGRGCLLARRLIEAGTRFVEVTTEYVPFFQWDTHKDGHTTVDAMHKEIDAPIAQLVRDLEAKGLLDHTLVSLSRRRRAKTSCYPCKRLPWRQVFHGESPQCSGIIRALLRVI